MKKLDYGSDPCSWNGLEWHRCERGDHEQQSGSDFGDMSTGWDPGI